MISFNTTMFFFVFFFKGKINCFFWKSNTLASYFFEWVFGHFNFNHNGDDSSCFSMIWGPSHDIYWKVYFIEEGKVCSTLGEGVLAIKVKLHSQSLLWNVKKKIYIIFFLFRLGRKPDFSNLCVRHFLVAKTHKIPINIKNWA